MPILLRNDCVGCGAPLDAWHAEQFVCDKCTPFLEALRLREEQRLAFLDGAVSVYAYKGLAASLIRSYKFHGQKQFAAFFAAQMSSLLQSHMDAWKPDCVTYIPIGFVRRRERGFNQSQLIAARIAQGNGLPCKALLAKSAFAKRQSALKDSTARWENVQHAFSAKHQSVIRGARVVLIDDVITTGATMSAASEILRQAGAQRVYAISIARVPARN